MKKHEQYQPKSKWHKYWSKGEKEESIKQAKKDGTYVQRRPNKKREPGKTKKFVKGKGKQVWLGKEFTTSGWVSEKTFKTMLKVEKGNKK